ncbi:transposase [Dankookia rubra]|uniref:transposase n=1 Tax=Dankookia rubra TaxID=1442381 RepID=UPI00240D0EC5|nr:transposase [Dankookia rubra]
MLRLAPTAAARETKAQHRRQNRCRSHRPLRPMTVQATGYLMLVTSLPAEVPAADVLEAYRLRWQVELAFKRLKSLLGIGRLPVRSEALARSWLFAHLIMALLIEDASKELLTPHPQQPATASCSTSLWLITKTLHHALLAAIRGLSSLAALLGAADVLARPIHRVGA